MKQDQISLARSSSTNNIFIPSNFTLSSSSSSIITTPNSNTNTTNSLTLCTAKKNPRHLTLSTFLRSLLHVFSFSTSSIPPCNRWLNIPDTIFSHSSPAKLGKNVTGTLFGHRKGQVTFAVQNAPRDDPALLIELAVSTSALVKEMSSGLVRIALQCEQVSHVPRLPIRGSGGGGGSTKLYLEPKWSMYCNGRKCGYATSRACTDFDSYVLDTVQSVSIGAGIIPVVENRTGSGSEGEVLYMRARFERVVGSRDSEAFYMLNPDGNGGPELSIFLLRL